jgi:hypothetical protein
MENFYLGYSRYQYLLYRGSPHFFLIVRAFIFWNFFIGSLLSVPFFAVCIVLPYGIGLRDLPPKVLEIFFITGCGVLAIVPIVFFNPHYAAPVLCSLYILLMFIMRRVWIWNGRQTDTGKGLVRTLVLACATLLASKISAGTLKIPPTWLDSPGNGSLQMTERSRILSSFQNSPVKELIIVRYSSDHDPTDEWVYNEANIESAKLVWARELDPSSNGQLVEHFKDRQIWLLQPDQVPPKLEKYPANDSPAVTSMDAASRRTH